MISIRPSNTRIPVVLRVQPVVLLGPLTPMRVEFIVQRHIRPAFHVLTLPDLSLVSSSDQGAAVAGNQQGAEWCVWQLHRIGT